MTKSVKTETATATIERLQTVAALIAQAGKAASTLTNKAREGARLASAQLNPATPLKERIAEVVAAYAGDFKAAGHNVRAIFVDALTLLACANTDVAVKIPAKGGSAETYVKAGEAVDMSKHNLKDAAKQVREAHGMARKAGGGAKPKAAPKVQAAPDMHHIDAFSNWLDVLPEYLQDSVFHGKIVAALIAEGYTLNRAAKGKVIKGAASA